MRTIMKRVTMSFGIALTLIVGTASAAACNPVDTRASYAAVPIVAALSAPEARRGCTPCDDHCCSG
jgi:hypothetical protein